MTDLLLTLLLALDGRIVRWEGGLLLLAFALWLGMELRTALRHRAASVDLPVPGEHPGPWQCLGLGIFGLTALIAAGRLFVLGAGGVAAALGVDSYVVGAILVAFGTSLPELVTFVLARLRGHDDVGVGTLIGSNLFNGLAIVGVATSLHAAAVPPAEVALTLGFGIAALLLLLPNRAGVIGRGRGALLLALYGGFVVATFAMAR